MNTSSPAGPRCAVYIRVSTEEQHLNGLSLPAQRKALTEYALSHGYAIAGIYADEGVSARKSMKNRKALMRLLEDVKADKIDMVLVTKLDRWFRSIKDYQLTEEILEKHNCHWKTIYEHYDSSTANGQMVINIMLSVNQAECDRTSERIKAVLEYKRSIGEVTSGRCACYGYRIDQNRLVKDEKASPLIEEAYRYYFICFSIRRTISHIQGLYGEAAPSAGILERLFKNETYAGTHRGVSGYCEPYLSPSQFQEIRRITQAKVQPGQKETYLFGSLIPCPVCGRRLSGYRRKHTRRDGETSVYIRYRCSAKYGRHPSPNISEDKTEAYLLSHIFPPCEGLSLSFQCRTAARNGTKDDYALRQEIDRLNLQFQKGRITETYYDKQYRLLQARLTHPGTVSSQEPPAAEFNGSLPTLYHSLDKAHRKNFWKALLSEIQVDSVTHKVCGFSFLP